MKRLRKQLDSKISYLMCGEYGSRTRRPHYHAIVFGHDFPDHWLYKHDRKRNVKIYRSDMLEKTWTQGISSIGMVTWQSAAYVARYTTKKITGEKAADHYRNVCVHTGEIFDIKPEYGVASNRPALGKAWFEKYHTDVFPGDQIIHNGRGYPVPRYYDKLYMEMNPAGFEQVRRKRIQRALADDPDPIEHRSRLLQKSQVKAAQNKQLVRSFDQDDTENQYVPLTRTP